MSPWRAGSCRWEPYSGPAMWSYSSGPAPACLPAVSSTSEAVAGRDVITPVHRNQPSLEAKLAPTGAGGGMTTMIDEGMRAVSVRVDEVIGVAGFVVPGTRVDVLLTLDVGGATREPATEVLMQNVRTLAGGPGDQRDAEGKPKSVPVVTLLVLPQAAETLALGIEPGADPARAAEHAGYRASADGRARLGQLFVGLQALGDDVAVLGRRTCRRCGRWRSRRRSRSGRQPRSGRRASARTPRAGCSSRSPACRSTTGLGYPGST